MKKILYCAIVVFLLLVSGSLHAIRPIEGFGRGLVAYRNVVNNINYMCVSWRYLSSDSINTQYNIYRVLLNSSGDPMSSTEIKVNDTPVSATWFRYEEKQQLAMKFQLKEVKAGVESATSIAEFILKKKSDAPNPYIEIPMRQIVGDTNWNYSPNDAVVADLDGDGEMEIVIHRTGSGQDNSQSGITDAPILQAYKLDGTFMWEINLGVNIREGAHYTQFMVYDLDGDGKAEVVCKTAEGTKDAVGTNVGEAYFPTYKSRYSLTHTFNPDAVYRNASGYILQGPEFLTVFNGETGTEIVTTEYDPPRYSTYNNGNEIPKLSPSTSEINSRWGDNYGNRVDRFLACVAYLGGDNYSVVMCRGYYTRTVLVAYDLVNGQLVKRWKFDTWTGSGNNAYAGQGNHNLRVADVDGDGFDEIIYGSMAVDHNGTGLYNTRLGHGDAMHLTDFIPERPGLEVLAVHENKVDGTTLRDAATGTIIYQVASGDDVGRGMGTDIDPTQRGMEFWSARSGGVRESATGSAVTTSTGGVSMNMACWWDGDLLRELQDGTAVTKFNYVTKNSSTTLLSATGCASNNSTKANPCLIADVLGDWREEVILRTSDNKNIRIYLTTDSTGYKFHTFLEDPVYRMSVVYQNVAYNQPTHTGFYFGSDLETIFINDQIYVEGDEYHLDPVFDAISYEWSTGEHTKIAVLKRENFQAGVETEVSLAINFRGHIFRDTVKVTFSGNSSVDDLKSMNDISLLNNVVEEELRIKSVNGGEYDYNIYSTSGKLCMKGTVQISQSSDSILSIPNLNAGMYILTLSNSNGNKNFKFIKK